MCDQDVIDAKIESINRCVNRIKEKMPRTAEALLHDIDAQDIIAVNLQRAIQLCVDLGAHLIASSGWSSPDSMAETFDVLAQHTVLDQRLAERLRRAVGFRNVSVHEYEDLDWNRVYAMITGHLDDFRTFVSVVHRHIA